MIDDDIHLETMINLDQRNLTVRRSDGTVTVSSTNEDSDADEDSTPRRRDFRADEISEPSEGEPMGVPSEVDETPSALKKGRSFGDAFQPDMDSDSNSESGQDEEDMRGGSESNTTISVVRQIEKFVHCSYLSN